MPQLTLRCPAAPAACDQTATWKVSAERDTTSRPKPTHVALDANCPRCQRPGVSATDELLVVGTERLP